MVSCVFLYIVHISTYTQILGLSDRLRTIKEVLLLTRRRLLFILVFEDTGLANRRLIAAPYRAQIIELILDHGARGVVEALVCLIRIAVARLHWVALI